MFYDCTQINFVLEFDHALFDHIKRIPSIILRLKHSFLVYLIIIASKTISINFDMFEIINKEVFVMI